MDTSLPSRDTDCASANDSTFPLEACKCPLQSRYDANTPIGSSSANWRPGPVNSTALKTLDFVLLGKTTTAAELETLNQELRMRGPFLSNKTWKIHVSFETDPCAEAGRHAAAVRRPGKRVTAVLRRRTSIGGPPNEASQGGQITLGSDSTGQDKQVGGFRSRLRSLVARSHPARRRSRGPIRLHGHLIVYGGIAQDV